MGGFMGRRKVPLYMRPPDAEKKGFWLGCDAAKRGKEKKTALKRQKCHQLKAVGKKGEKTMAPLLSPSFRQRQRL